LEGSGFGIIEILTLHLPGGTEKNHEKPVRVAASPKYKSEALPLLENAHPLGGVFLQYNVMTTWPTP
jgi:hypothetical protein